MRCFLSTAYLQNTARDARFLLAWVVSFSQPCPIDTSAHATSFWEGRLGEVRWQGSDMLLRFVNLLLLAMARMARTDPSFSSRRGFLTLFILRLSCSALGMKAQTLHNTNKAKLGAWKQAQGWLLTHLAHLNLGREAKGSMLFLCNKAWSDRRYHIWLREPFGESVMSLLCIE